jgi:beta-lactamase superfamily II metal-dependent hydrolase
MYNVGFGDCFLLFIPTDDGERTMLVDCGKHMSSTTGHPIGEAVDDVIATITKDGRARLDIVVASHRHFDHISGFDRKQWDSVEVGEVWMPWTEQVGNPDADRIRHEQKRLALELTRRFSKIDGAPGALAWNSLSNRGAETRLRSGFSGRALRRYLPHDETGPHEFSSPLLPGVRIHALGPSHDRDVIALLQPPAGMYFPAAQANRNSTAAAAVSGRSGRSRAGMTKLEVSFPPVFADGYQVDAPTYAERYPRLAKATSREALDEQCKLDALAAAAGLEDAINGTSLVFALEVGDACILLAGDAEWGTWSKILPDPKSRQLLSRTRAYKVSHHGSYNGTPKPFVDDVLPADAVSLVSLGPMAKWPSIPRRSLLDALGTQRRRVLRSDRPAPATADVQSGGTLWTEVVIPT